MDLSLTIIFYVCTGLAVVAALVAVVGPDAWRAAALLAMALAAALAVAALSAWLVALVALVSLGAAALLVGGLAPAERQGGPGVAAQVGAVASAALLVVLLYASARGVFFAHPSSSAPGPADVGRALFGRDALAVEAAGALLLIALASAAVAGARRR